MASLKDNFTKGLTTLNVKTNNFMEESKCKTYITTLENEIAGLKQKLGDDIYTSWMNQGDLTAGVEETCKQIQNKYQEIEAQKLKIAQLQEEEKQILGAASVQTTSQAAPAQNAMPEGETIFCSQCGTKNSVNYKFCCKCGAPLK